LGAHQKAEKGQDCDTDNPGDGRGGRFERRIAGIVDGSLKCIGTQLYLKNQFGEGLRLTLVTDKDDVPFVCVKVKQIIPSARILDESGGSIVITVPLANIKESNGFFK